jgi:hypothetical protein
MSPTEARFSNHRHLPPSVGPPKPALATRSVGGRDRYWSPLLLCSDHQLHERSWSNRVCRADDLNFSAMEFVPRAERVPVLWYSPLLIDSLRNAKEVHEALAQLRSKEF